VFQLIHNLYNTDWRSVTLLADWGKFNLIGVIHRCRYPTNAK